MLLRETWLAWSTLDSGNSQSDNLILGRSDEDWLLTVNEPELRSTRRMPRRQGTHQFSPNLYRYSSVDQRMISNLLSCLMQVRVLSELLCPISSGDRAGPF